MDLLFVKCFDVGEPIVCISTDAGKPLSAVLERSTCVPALGKASFNCSEDFFGSTHEWLFGLHQRPDWSNNRLARGFRHLVLDGHASDAATASYTALIDALRNGGDLLNVIGDSPPSPTLPGHGVPGACPVLPTS